jgi:hypothetical protein
VLQPEQCVIIVDIATRGRLASPGCFSFIRTTFVFKG